MRIGLYVSAAVLFGLAAGAAAAQSGPKDCSAAAHRQFDFWVGEWAVTDRATGQPAGTSHIEKLYGGCVLRENYAVGNFRGGSLNIYSRDDGSWHQTWMDFDRRLSPLHRWAGQQRPDGNDRRAAAQAAGGQGAAWPTDVHRQLRRQCSAIFGLFR